MQFFNLVGKREAKGANEEAVMLEPTRGNFRISPAVAKQLDIVDGSFVTVQEAEIDGKTVIFIGKGKDGVATKDENGNDVFDARGRRIYEEGNEGFGAATREINPGTNIFRFSVASGWEKLGGDTDKRKYYTLGEGMEVTLPVGDGQVHTTVLYPLEFEREEDKLVRNSSDDTVEATAPVSALSDSQASASFDEEEL